MTHGASVDPTLLFALSAGLASFLSPCVLPVLPAFIAHLGGTSLGSDPSRRKIFTSTALFVVGFSLVFALLGVLLQGVFRSVSSELLTWISRLAGTVIILFGLHLSGVITVRTFDHEYGLTARFNRFEPGYATSLLFGGAFAVAWTPCVGPLLGSVLGLAATKPVQAFPLLGSYAIGLGLPFLLVGLFPRQFYARLRARDGFLARLQRFFGYVLVGLGVLVFANELNRIASVEYLLEAVA